MKKYIKTTILILIVAACTYSCESFIEVDVPKSQLTGLAVFEDTPTATAALTDIYARLREEGMVTGTGFGLSNLMANYADELTFYGSSTVLESFNNHTIVPSNSFIAILWSTSYSQIYALNALIQGLENSNTIALEDKNKLLGEALFLRAYIHFYLVNCFGDIPYVNSTNYLQNAKISKISETDVWQNILTDLGKAEELLPESYTSAERVRANKFVIKAMKARVYLYLQNWVLAETYASQVIDSRLYVWEQNIENVFLKENPGIIWALHPGIAGLNTKDARTFIFSSGPPTKPALAANLMDAFELNDRRKVYWVKTITKGTDNWYHANKYKKTLNTGTSQEYTILFRLAEQYLIRAEANAQLENTPTALQDLNKLRFRAGLQATTATTKQEILTAVRQERRIELFTEQGHRWFDLKRTGEAAAVLSPIKSNWQNTQLKLPIPEAELILNINLLPQNQGY